MDNQQPTNQEILEAISDFASHNDEEISEIKAIISTQLVTKQFFIDKLNEKFADFRGELMTLLRKGDNKLCTLAGKLLKHKVLPTKAVQEVLAMEPFSSSR